jgi:arginyl-tRNA synthetase
MNPIERYLKEKIAQAIKRAFDLELDLNDVIIENPKVKEHGDYSTNVAMRLSKQLSKNPRELAEKIVDVLDQSEFDQVELAGAGFINFKLKASLVSSVLDLILKEKEKYGYAKEIKDQKINIEYVSANPTGDLHPGHARGAAIGDSLSRIMKAAGYQVTREYYLNDAGNQINNMAKSLQARYLQRCGQSVEVPEEGYHGKDLIEIAEDIYKNVQDKYALVDPSQSLAMFKELGLTYETEKLKEDLSLFGCEFDVWSSEQALYDQGLVQKSLQRLIDLGHTYEHEGALFLRSTEYGDDKDRVLRKSDGSYTYLTPDIAYHLDKKQRGFDVLINLWGADHHGYIPRIKAAFEALSFNPNDLHVDVIQMARMIKNGVEFKLSKRTGKAVALKDLIEEAGVDAVRYYFVSKAGDTHMDLDLDMASSQSADNPVYYAQYAHARVSSILRQADVEADHHFDLLVHEKEKELMMMLADFGKWIENASSLRQPHLMCLYIHKLASAFHSFYNECSVLHEEDALKKQRLALVLAVKITLSNALNLIGVSAPEKM